MLLAVAMLLGSVTVVTTSPCRFASVSSICPLPTLTLAQDHRRGSPRSGSWSWCSFPGCRSPSELAGYESTTERERRRLTEQVAALKRERYKWAEKAMSGAVPDDIARERQQGLASQLSQAESALGRLAVNVAAHEETLTAALLLVARCGRAYQLSNEPHRRDYNQAWFKTLALDVDDETLAPAVVAVRHTPVIAVLQQRRSRFERSSELDHKRAPRQHRGTDGVDHPDVSEASN